VKIGWIGLGKIGSIMAANLLKAGYTMIVHDLTPESGEELVAAGTQWAKSPCELAEAADIVITSLPGPPQVKKVIVRDEGGTVVHLFTDHVLAATSKLKFEAPMAGHFEMDGQRGSEKWWFES